MDLFAATPWLLDIGRSLREAFFMFWATLWPLVLGFALSGAVQAFVSRQAMQRKLGTHRPVAVLRAASYGMASSSCSYAASAMAKSLFMKGADFVSAIIFMFASTNLVVELGIVLIVLMGWQFAVSEFAGGVIMIFLLAVLGGAWLRGRALEAARERLSQRAPCQPDDDRASSPAPGGGTEAGGGGPRSLAGWADAASYTMSDLGMVRRELVIGYAVAGFLTVLVPTSFWHSVFLSGHGVWTSIENAVVGPFIALISFVCSIGNVPLAASLWKGGIAFGGVVSFLFADLIALPLLLIYRRYYGLRLTVRLLILFWAVMSLAGLLTEGIFRAAGLVPTARSATIVSDQFSWNYTTYLNIVFLLVLALLYWLSRNRHRLGGGRRIAVDPVCGMQVDTSAPASSIWHDGERLAFCSDRCAERFRQDADRYVTAGSDHGRTKSADAR